MTNWSGNITGGGTDQLLIGDSTKTGLTAGQLSKVHFQGFHTGAALVVNGGNWRSGAGQRHAALARGY